MSIGIDNAMNESAKGMEAQLRKLITMVLHVWSLPLQVLVRHEFGERYHTFPRMIIAAWVYGMYLVLVWQNDESIPLLLFILFPVWFVAACIHLWNIRSRNKAGEPWHSRSFGVSHFQDLLPGSDWTLYRFVEPGALFLLSGLVMFFNPFAGGYFAVASVLLFFEANFMHATYRTHYLDRMDSYIEAQFWSGTTKDAGKHANYGFEAAGVAEDLEHMLEKAQAARDRRRGQTQAQGGEPRPTSVTPARPFEDIDSAVQATMTTVVDTSPNPVAAPRPESKLNAPADTGVSRLAARLKKPPEPSEDAGTWWPSSPQQPAKAEEPSPPPEQKTTPPPKPPNEWGDY